MFNINFNGKSVTISDSGTKTYITKRNSWSGKGQWFKVYTDSEGHKFVKFWNEQVALVKSNNMVRAYDIVK